MQRTVAFYCSVRACEFFEHLQHTAAVVASSAAAAEHHMHAHSGLRGTTTVQ
jgi:hypothetical protein